MQPVLTMVGSLPPATGETDEILRRAVELERSHGIRLLTDGEPRGDMLSYYTHLPGIVEGRGVPRIKGRIQPVPEPFAFPKVRDLDRLRALYPDARFKVSLTGPTTFLLACAAAGAGPEYRGPMDPNLHDDLTEALRPLAREIGRRDAYLQIDEPILSQGMRDYEPALRRIDLIASEVPRQRALLHVCGGLARSKALDALMRLQGVSVLNLAFAGRAESENRGLLVPDAWKEHDILLGAGAIDVQVSRPEEVSSSTGVETLLRELATRVGPERVAFVTPDCGLRATPSELVPHLLESLHRGFTRVFPEAE